MIAIIPAAGKGARMESITKGAPKELLPLGRSTVLGRVIHEALDVCDEVIVVNSPSKAQINVFVEMLENPKVKLRFQPEPRGLGDAICCSQAQDDVIVLLGDTVYRSDSPILRMADLIHRGIDGAIAVEPVATDIMSEHVVVDVDPLSGAVIGIFENPRSDETSSRWAVAARFAFSHRLLVFLGHEAQRRASESQITLVSLLKRALEEGFDIKAVALQPQHERVDCGKSVDYRCAVEMKWD